MEVHEIMSETDVKQTKVKFTWKIKNFSKSDKQKGDSLLSPVFYAEDASEYRWILEFYPTGTRFSKHNSMSLFIILEAGNGESCSVTSAFCLLDDTGNETNVCTNQFETVLCTDEQSWGTYDFIRIRDLMMNKSTLLPNDTLTVVCKLKISMENTHSHNKTVQFCTSSLQVIDDLERLLCNENLADVTIVINGDKFLAHKIILAARSSVFEDMFTESETYNNVAERSVIDVVEIHDIDINSAVFPQILKFIYSGKIDISSIANDDVTIDLWIASNKFAIDDLKIICEEVLGNHLTVENINDMSNFANSYDASRLREKCVSFMATYTKDVCNNLCSKDKPSSDVKSITETLSFFKRLSK